MDLPAIKSVRSLANVTQPEISCPESQDFLSTFPTAMFRSILERLQTLEIIPLRLVSNRWKVVIESICSDKKCVVVMHQPNRYYLRAKLFKRFNLNELSKDSMVFKLKYYQREVIHLSGHLFTLLPKIFPRLEQFYILDYATYFSSEFNSMLHQWSSSLTSLCVRLHYSEDVNDLCAQINQLTNLRQLNLDTLPGSGTQYCQLAPTFARLEYLSGSGYETIDKIAPYLGENFSGLGFACSTIPYMKLEELTNWYHLNAQSVSNLMCFSLYSNDDAIFPFICRHFSSLKVLRIYVGYSMLTPMIRQLVQLTHLTELHIDGNWIDVTALEDFSLRPLRNIRIWIFL